MNSRIISLPDLSEMEVNPEYREYTVSYEMVMELISHMKQTLGETVEVDAYEENCGLLCSALDGRAVYLYPDMHLPGVETRTELSGCKTGDQIPVSINGKEMTVEIEKITVNRSCEDEMVAAKAEIPGVQNLEELKAYLKEKEESKNKETNIRQCVMEMHEYLSANAVAEIDEKEITAWTEEQARLSYDENMSMGIDLRFTETGDMLSEEEVIKQLASDLRRQFVSNLADKKFAEDRGYAVDAEAIRTATLSEMEAMGMTDPAEMEKNVQLAIENDYFRFVYETLTEMAKEVLG